MAGSLVPEISLRAIGADGLALAGAKLYFFLTTTTTPSNVFTTSALSVAHSHPVVADSGGLFPAIFLDPAVAYRRQLKTSAGSLLEDLDPVSVAGNNAAGSITSAMLAVGAAVANIGFTPADASTSIQTGRHQMMIKADGMIPRTTNGAAAGSTESTTSKIMITGYDFDQTTSEAIQIMIPMPKSVTVTSLTYRVRWTAISGSGVVIWGVRAVGCSDDDTLDATFGTGVTVSDTLLAVQDQHTTAESTAVTVGGSPAVQDMLVIELYRDAANGSDTHSADARALALELFLTISATTDT